MSITYELRAMLNMTESINTADIQDLYEIADRIDEQVAKMYEDLTIGMEPMDAEHMAEHGWVKLPVDADGVPWRIGDRIEEMNGEVVRLMLGEGGWTFSVDGLVFDCDGYHHVQPDTRERLIEDGVRLVSDNVARRTEMECGEVLKQDAFDALMDGFNIGRARGYDEGFGAHLADLEARVSAIERKLNHRGER